VTSEDKQGSDADFDPVAYARSEVAPVLSELVELCEHEKALQPVAFFRAICVGIEAARSAEDLAGPFMELSSSAFLGFQYSPRAALLLDIVLERAAGLSEALALAPEELH